MPGPATQRDLHRRVVDEEAVLLFAVLAERFAMIADDDDSVSSRRPSRSSDSRSRPTSRVGRRDLGVVRALKRLREARPERLGGARYGACGS